MMSVRELREWLSTLDPDDSVGVTDGGLALATEDGESWVEVGGLPEDSDGAQI